MEVYGLKGAIYSDNRHDLRVRIATGYDDYEEKKIKLPERKTPLNDPFVYFASVINGNVKTDLYGLSSLENNMIVMEILDAAIKSSKLKQSIELKNDCCQ